MKSFKMNKPVFLIFFITLIIASYSCNNPEPYSGSDGPAKKIPSVCIWDQIGTRNEPRKASPVSDTVNLGDVLEFTGNTAVDSTFHNQVYYQVLLKDKQVWIPKMAVVTDAVPAVITEEAVIYLRPDLLTVTEKKITAMEIVAVTGEQDGWAEFCSEKKQLYGWIKKESLTYEKDERIFALFAKKKLNEKSEESLEQRIDFILNHAPVSSPLFSTYLEKIRQEETEKKFIQEMMTGNSPG